MGGKRLPGIEKPRADYLQLRTTKSPPKRPPAGYTNLYRKSDGRLYSMGADGTEYGPFDAGGGGSDFIATMTADSNLTAYWPLNEHGTTYADAIGTADLVAQGTTPGFGQAQNADLAGGSLVIPSNVYRVGRSTSLTWGSTFSYGCLITLFPSGDSGLIGQWDGAGSMAFITSNTIRAYSGANFASWAASLDDILGTHLLVVTHDGTNVKLWWDGVEKATSAQTIPGTNVGGHFALGSYSSGSGGGGKQVCSDAFFCQNHVLTGAEQLAIAALADL